MAIKNPEDGYTRGRVTPGPKAETLKIEGDPEEAIRRILNVRKPEGGWPKPNENGQPTKKRGGH